MKKKTTLFKVRNYNLEEAKSKLKYEALISRAYQDKSTIEITEEERIIKTLTLTDEDGSSTKIQQIWMMVKYLETTTVEVASRQDTF